MSALTKIFVILLVVLSLLLSAGLIVFVNRQENFKADAANFKKKAADELLAKTSAMQETAKVSAQKDAAVAELTSQINAKNAELATANTTIGQKDGQINELNQNLAQATITSNTIAATVQTAQAQIKAQTDTIAGLQAANDKQEKLVVEDSNRITDLTNQNEVLNKHDRFMTEQNTQKETQIAQLSDILRKYNISPSGTTTPPGGAINAVPSVNINGIVRDFKKIDGVPFATISLGSADAVTRGMKFNVIDPGHNRFLGYLTVDQVNAHDATGRLDGPGVNEVRPNISEVRTQL